MGQLDSAIECFARLFDERDIPYALIGGIAVRVHALPRPTFDVDFTALIDRDQLSDLYKVVGALGYTISTAQYSGWVDQVHGLPVIKFQWFVGEQPIDVDVFLAETAFKKQLLLRRQQHRVDGFKAWFASAEDLILLKLMADRPKDQSDVADILFVQGKLDEGYLRRWAEILKVSESLERALAGQRE